MLHILCSLIFTFIINPAFLQTIVTPRASLRLRPIRPLPRAPYQRGPIFVGKFFFFFIYKYFWVILKYFSIHFFSLLRGLKE